jgi:hypothetical protein
LIRDDVIFGRAIKAIDEENSRDPVHEFFRGREFPKELLYSMRITEWLHRLAPDASEELQLAARGHHISRWAIPRKNYEMNRKGYLLWRTALKKFHAEKIGKILDQCGYDPDIIRRVQSLIMKERLKADPETQLLEDVICLVFLEYELNDFSQKHNEEKIITILWKTWKKMSDKAQQEALSLDIPDTTRDLIRKAVGQSGTTTG